mmetsp:Transcript_28696/g.72054  ORF Transcript_28696/g.72054 Transcript_28696/m.72054 type:complete len:351 (-) Transcript_28696:302-1354(-)
MRAPREGGGLCERDRLRGEPRAGVVDDRRAFHRGGGGLRRADVAAAAAGRGGVGQGDGGGREAVPGGVQGAEESAFEVCDGGHARGEGDLRRAAVGGGLRSGGREGHYGVRRHARAVLRPHDDFRAQRPAVRGEPLSVQRRLCGPRVVQRGGDHDAARVQGVGPPVHASHARQPRVHQHEQDLRVPGRGQGKILGPHIHGIHRALPVAAAGIRPRRHRSKRKASPRAPRRPLQQGRRQARRPPQNQPLHRTRLRPHVRNAVVRPAKGARLGALQARHRRGLRPRRHEALPRRQQPPAPRAQPRDEGGRVRGRGRRSAHHRVFGAELLRPDGQQGRVHPVRAGDDAGYQAV